MERWICLLCLFVTSDAFAGHFNYPGFSSTVDLNLVGDTLVMDNKLLQSIDVTRGLKPGGWILINAPQAPADLASFAEFQVAWVDATGIALQHRLGTRTSPIINTAMLGAYARVHAQPAMEHVEQAILNEVPIKQQENVRAARDAFAQVQLHGRV